MVKIDASLALWLTYCIVLLAISSCSGKQITNVRRRDSLAYGQKLEVSDTIISPNGYFELGFFSRRNPKKRYLGIWFKKSSTHAIVWVANRSNPLLSHSPTLKFQQNGNLVIMEGNATSFLVTNVSLLYDKKTRIILQDTGNLLLQDKNSKVVWQSFDFPTDTILPGMKYGYDKTTGKTWSYSAWKNAADPRPGRYSVTIDPTGSGWAIIWDRNQIHGLYWVAYKPNTDRVYNMRNRHITFTTYGNQPNNTFYIVFHVDDKDFFVRYVLDTVGVFHVYYWYKGDREWTNIMKLPNRVCDFNGYCGNYAICDENSRSKCSCFQGFQPRDPRNWEKQNYEGGCERTKDLVGNKTDRVDFIKVANVTLPSNPTFVPEIKTIEDCKSVCSSNTSCNGYSYSEHWCWIVCEDVTNVQRPSSSFYLGLDMYIKVPTSDSNKINYMSMLLCVLLLSILLVFY